MSTPEPLLAQYGDMPHPDRNRSGQEETNETQPKNRNEDCNACFR